MNGYITNIEKDTLENTNFRKVLFTAKGMQLVLMSLKPNEEIGEEVHSDVDQFFRIEQGTGKVVLDDEEFEVTDGFVFVVRAGAKHNVINISPDVDLKLYTIYTPPEHIDQVIHQTKEDAMNDVNDVFDGKITL